MADLTSVNRTDNVDDVHAADVNVLQAGSFYGGYVNAESLSGTKTLTDADFPYQDLNPNGSDRIVNLPAKAATNHQFIINNSGSANTLTVKQSGGTVLAILAAGIRCLFVPSTTKDYYVLGPIDPAGSSSNVWRGDGTWGAAGGGDKYPLEARLTLETGVPYSSTAQTAKTIAYLTKYLGDQIAVYDGASAWSNLALGSDISIKTTDAQTGTTTNGNAIISGLTDTSQLMVGMAISGTNVGAASVIVSIDSPTQVTGSVNSTGSASNTITFKVPASTMVDIYVYSNSGTAKIEGVIWTNATTRATALTTQNGVNVKTGATTRRFVGCLLTTATAGQLEMSKSYGSISNMYNRIRHNIFVCPKYTDDSNNTTYTTTSTTWVEANGGTGSRANFALCDTQDINALVQGRCTPPSGQTTQLTIGFDTISNPSKSTFSLITTDTTLTASDEAVLAAGSHYISLLIAASGGGTATWFADVGAVRLGASQDAAATYFISSYMS